MHICIYLLCIMYVLSLIIIINEPLSQHTHNLTHPYIHIIGEWLKEKGQRPQKSCKLYKHQFQ